MIEFVLTFLAVAAFFGAVEGAFWGLIRAHDWVRPTVPGWFKPDLRDEHMGMLNRIPRAPIRYWRWSRKRHAHQWGPWRIIRREGRAFYSGHGCRTCPTIESLSADGRIVLSEHTVTPAMLETGVIPFD